MHSRKSLGHIQLSFRSSLSSSITRVRAVSQSTSPHTCSHTCRGSCAIPGSIPLQYLSTCNRKDQKWRKTKISEFQINFREKQMKMTPLTHGARSPDRPAAPIGPPPSATQISRAVPAPASNTPRWRGDDETRFACVRANPVRGGRFTRGCSVRRTRQTHTIDPAVARRADAWRNGPPAPGSRAELRAGGADGEEQVTVREFELELYTAWQALLARLPVAARRRQPPCWAVTAAARSAARSG